MLRMKTHNPLCISAVWIHSFVYCIRLIKRILIADLIFSLKGAVTPSILLACNLKIFLSCAQ